MRLREALELDDKMSDAQIKKREEIVMAMKKNKKQLKARYGDKWESVMYAIATKQARKLKDEGK